MSEVCSRCNEPARLLTLTLWAYGNGKPRRLCTPCRQCVGALHVEDMYRRPKHRRHEGMRRAG